MKVLIDTNILLDVILLREPHLKLSKRVLTCCQSLVDGYIAVHAFSNMFYILHETEGFSIEECRNTFNKLLYVFDVASLDKSDVIAAEGDEEGARLLKGSKYILTAFRETLRSPCRGRTTDTRMTTTSS